MDGDIFTKVQHTLTITSIVAGSFSITTMSLGSLQ